MDNDAQPYQPAADAADLVTATFRGLDRGLGAVMHAWRKAVGPVIAERCMPVRITGETLRVRCADAAWAQEIQLNSGIYLEALRRLLGDAAPTRLACVTGTVRPPAPADLDTVAEALTARPKRPVDPAAVAAAEQLAGAIGDPDLRHRMARAIAASRTR